MQQVINDIIVNIDPTSIVDDCWLISDTHFYHKNVQEYCGRPDNWQELIISNWNNLIKKHDMVLHLGDFSFGSKEIASKVSNRLNGNIFMLRGNHDRHSKSWYADLNITIIPNFIINAHHILYFTHKSIKDKNFYGINIHGHSHNASKQVNIVKDVVFVNMCVEMNDYKPVKLSEILKRLRDEFKRDVSKSASIY